MTLDLLVILILGIAAFLYAAFVRGNGRGWALLVGSVVAIYWLQPNLPIRFAPFILQTTTVLLTVGVWWLTKSGENDEFRNKTRKEDVATLLVVFLLIVGLAFNRYLNADIRLLDYRPPPPLIVASVLGLITLFFIILGRWLRFWSKRRILSAAIFTIILLFVILKTEPFAAQIAAIWRRLTEQDVNLAGISDLAWLGFSYVAFRLIHTLRDSQTGSLPHLSLA